MAERKKLKGVSDFFYAQANEERGHMIKLMRYINIRGGEVRVQSIAAPQVKSGGLMFLFSGALEQEEKNTRHINKMLDSCLVARDHISHQFLQWYAAEQVEEENKMKTLVDKLELIGDNKGGLYSFDRDLSTNKDTSVAAKMDFL